LKIVGLNEDAFKTQFDQDDHISIAGAYLDLSQGVMDMSSEILCYMHAISNLICALEQTVKEDLRAYRVLALKDAIETYVLTVFQLARGFASAQMEIYVHRFIVSCLDTIGKTLKSKTLVAEETEHTVNIFSENSQKIYRQSLENVAKRLPKLCPLMTIWRGWADEEMFGNFQDARTIAMMEFLDFKEHDVRDVEDLMQWPLLRRTEDGWLDNENTSLDLGEYDRAEVFERFVGFDYNEETGEVVFLMERATFDESSSNGLFTMNDVLEIMDGSISDVFFTLENPDPSFRVHPFQEFSYWPKTLDVRNLLLLFEF